MDTVNRKRRSEIMSSIRSARNRSTEWKLRSALIRAGLQGWRVTPLGLAGRPDFSFPRKKLAVFVDGCFWHGCPNCYRRPGSNRKFWDRKILRNKLRDKVVRCELRILGWRVIRIWECALAKRPQWCVRRVQRALLGKKPRQPTVPGAGTGILKP